MKQMKNYKTGKIAFTSRSPGIPLIFDEYVASMEMLGTKKTPQL